MVTAAARAAVLSVRAAARPAWLQLQEALATSVRPVPCQQHPERADWWADPPGAEVAEYAANLCRGCPVLAECSRFADTNRERHGIWAGRNRTKQPGRPRTSTTTSNQTRRF